MSKKWPGGIITPTPVEPTTDAAPGIWTVQQAAFYTKQGTWPTPQPSWATYWATNESPYEIDGTPLTTGTMAVDANLNAYFGFEAIYGPRYYKFNVGTNSAGSPLFFRTANTGLNASRSSSLYGAVLQGTNRVATNAVVGTTLRSRANITSYSVATPASPGSAVGKTIDGDYTGEYDRDTYGVAASPDGSMYISGETTTGSSTSNYFIAKFNSGGTKLWQKANGSSRFYSSITANDTLLYGTDTDAGSSTVRVAQFDPATGNANWGRILDFTGITWPENYSYTRCCIGSSNALIVGASYKAANNFSVFITITRVTSDGGAISWSKRYYTNGTIAGITYQNGFIYLTTYTSSYTQSLRILKVRESDGSIVWQRSLGQASFNGSTFPLGLSVTASGAMFVAFSTRPANTYYQVNIWRLPASGAGTGSSAGGVTYSVNTNASAVDVSTSMSTGTYGPSDSTTSDSSADYLGSTITPSPTTTTFA